MPTRGKPYPREIRERAVRMVLEHQQDYELAVGGDLFGR
jgi:transposase-like protein